MMDRLNAADYKNIIFDLDGTLVHKNPPIFTAIEEVFTAHGIQFSDEHRRQAGIWSHRFWNNMDNYHESPVIAAQNGRNPFWPKYLAFYFELLDIPRRDFEDYYKVFDDVFREDQTEEYLAADARNVLQKLRLTQFRLGVLSNRYYSLNPVIERFQISEFFQAATAAGELDAYKPDEEIFFLFLDKFGGRTDETLYIGDNYWLDVRAAMRAGIQPVMVDPYEWYSNIDCPIIRDLTGLLSLLGID